MQLDISNIQLDAKVSNKSEAIHQAGKLLVDSAHIKPGYIDSMMEREKVANTFLGNGIAIPHGMPKDREMILRTGISVTQVPGGVEWNPGETVFLVVGIAARSDEHIQLLANLTDVLDDERTVKKLAKTKDASDIIAALTKPRGDGGPPPMPAEVEIPEFEKAVDVTVDGGTGLHARPATAFVSLAKQFEAEILVRHGDKVSNGKSLASLLKLGVESGGSIRIMAQGPDADDALTALKSAVMSGLGEEEEPEEAVRLTAAPGWQPVSGGSVIPGISASPGLAIGPLRQFKRTKIVVAATAKDPSLEYQRLNQALEAARVQLEDLYKEVKQRSSAGKASIFLAHAEFLDDPDMIQEARAEIRKGHSAGWAWREVIERRVSEMAKLDDPLLASRAVDLSDVGKRVLRFLADSVEDEPSQPEEPVILVAEDLTPSDTASLDPTYILGFCTAAGGPTSHTAIIARALGIPAIVSAGPVVLHQEEGNTVILDGSSGSLYVEPSEEDLKAAQRAQQDMLSLREAEFLTRYQPAIMTDGHRVEVVANINRVPEAEQAVNAGGEGVGLLRTEFLFLERSEPPSEDEQFEAYSAMAKALNGLPLIIRTLDIGGDKKVPYLNLPPEDNSFLGVRGIRLCLSQPELFKPQLRAIFRASKYGPIHIMYPMISRLEDLKAAKEITEEMRKEVGVEPLHIGIMIEVPSAVLIADVLAKEADFFSIGTNDLTQYTLAMDRLHPVLAKQADGLHPAVLRMVERTVEAASEAGIWVGVCGGIAGDPLGSVILTGLGVNELSVTIPSIAAVKARLRQISLEDAQALAQKALSCSTAGEVRALQVP